MKRVFRWAGVALASVAVLAVVLALGAFGASEAMIRWPQPKAEVRMVAASDPGAVARGKRIATLNGCHDCHGADLTGRLFFDEMPLARVAGPNLALAMARQSDADLARAIRQGVAADGRSLWVMPSEAFAHLTDGETADLIAYLRTFPARGAVQPAKQVGPVGRIGVLLGQLRSAPAMIEADRGVSLPDLGPEHAEGRSLARACVECHGQQLEGLQGVKSPDLTIAAAYDPADFERLMRTGVAAGGRRLGLMSEVAPVRFNAFSHQEIAALQAYLKARAAKGT
jgi:cytochrome c553